MIPYGRQHVTADDIQAVIDVLRSEFLTQGPAVPRFEEAMAKYCGASHAVAANSATSALHLACLALGVGPGGSVWTTPISFVASANCARFCGADVDFVDIDPRTYNLSVEALEAKLKSAEKGGNLPDVVIPVHLCGQSCDMAAIWELSKRYGFRIIEDASHAVGGKYRSAPVGNCAYSDVTVFSFHPVKVITTGEGGLALTNNQGLARQMRRQRSHGITRDAGEMTHEPDGPWYYQQIDLGFNYRMTDIQAALGLSQLARLDDLIARRHAIARRYDTALSRPGVTLPWQNHDCHSAMHLYVIQVEGGRRRVFEELRRNGIGANVHYIPIHLQPYYRRLGFKEGQFPEAERYYARAISLPIFPTLTDEQQGHVIRHVSSALSVETRS